MPVPFSTPPLRLEDLRRLNPDQLEKIRHLLKTDIGFLYCCALRNPKNKKELPLSEKCHRPLLDNFVRKDPSKDWDQQDLSRPKIGLFLSPRGSLKTTLDCADIVQWLLCFPDIRIVLLSGKLDHAKEMLEVVQRWFQENEILRFLFPAWCPERLRSDFYDCPARTPGIIHRGHSIMLGSTETGWAGMHGEICKLDDFENEKNTQTPETRKARIEDYDDLDPVLEPDGYIDVLGTLYGEGDDLYCELMRRDERQRQEQGTPLLRLVTQPVWTLREGASLVTVKPEDVLDLLWEKFKVSGLIRQAHADPRKFARQYLMQIIPEDVGAVFSQTLLDRTLRPAKDMPLPHRSVNVQNWDLSGLANDSSTNKGDNTVGINCVAEDTGRFFALDGVSTRYKTPTDIAEAIVDFAAKWKPVRVRIEDDRASRMIEPLIEAIARRKGVNVPLFFEPAERKKDAKLIRISALEVPMRDGRMQIFDGFPLKEALFDQLLKHPQLARMAHDDEADCLAQLWQHFSGTVKPMEIPQMRPEEDSALPPWMTDEKPGEDRVEADACDPAVGDDGLPSLLSEGFDA